MAEWWEDYQWRMIQTNMRECDAEALDAKKFVSDLVSFNANAVMISFGGTLANYDTSVPLHVKNPHKSGDSLEELIKLCHKSGIKVVARLDFSRMHSSVFALHPEWAYRDEKGEALESNGYYSTCKNGGFQQDFMDSVIKEVLTSFDIDGIYLNMSSFMIVDYSLNLHAPCHCINCQNAFKAMSGYSIPDKDLPFVSITEPGVKEYQAFKSLVTSKQKKRVEELIHSINPHVAYCSYDYIRQESNTELFRNQLPWVYSASSNTRTMVSSGKSGENASVDMMGFSARNTSISPSLHELRLWQSLANFGGLDFFVMGRLDNKGDTSGYDRVKRIFGYAKDHEESYRGLKSKASVLLLRDSYTIPNPEERGWITILTQLHIPFDEVLSSDFEKKELTNYSLIILPEKNRIKCEKINEYVQNGGNVLALGKLSPSLESGVSVGKFVNSVGANVHLEKNPLFPSLMDRNQVPVGKGYYQTKLNGAEEVLEIMPPESFGPPEVCYCQEESTGNPAFTIYNNGKGKVVYIPWLLGTTYYTESYDIWLLLAKDILENIFSLKSIAPSLTPMVEVTMGVKDGAIMLQLVNTSGFFGSSFVDPITVRNAEIVIPYFDYKEVLSLYKKDNVTVEKKEDSLVITVKELDFYEAIEITKQVGENE